MHYIAVGKSSLPGFMVAVGNRETLFRERPKHNIDKMNRYLRDFPDLICGVGIM
jgi:hypothetical protein